MAIKYHPEIEQQSEKWREIRIGKLTASVINNILTPKTLKIANNDDTRRHVCEIAAQRLTQYVEPEFEGFDILRGRQDEEDARVVYNEKIAPVERCGFIENDEWGFTIGYSPDGLIGDDGLLEIKSRCQALQFKTIVDSFAEGDLPIEHRLQVQTGLLVSKRKWIDYATWCGGFYMAIIRIESDPDLQSAIIEAARIFEKKVMEKLDIFNSYRSSPSARFIVTERRKEEEITPS